MICRHPPAAVNGANGIVPAKAQAHVAPHPVPSPLPRPVGCSRSALAATGNRLAFAGTTTPVRGGTLNILAGAEPPVLTSIAQPPPRPTSAPRPPKGCCTTPMTCRPLPLLATAWSVSQDGLNYKFTLRQGVKWHDGKDFTAADVAYSIATVKQVHPRGPRHLRQPHRHRYARRLHGDAEARQAGALSADRARTIGNPDRPQASL